MDFVARKMAVIALNASYLIFLWEIFRKDSWLTEMEDPVDFLEPHIRCIVDNRSWLMTKVQTVTVVLQTETIAKHVRKFKTNSMDYILI
jgi:hypothetical protein